MEQVGAQLQLYDRPANRFVASFLGSPAMNFVPGRVSGDGAFVSDYKSLVVSGLEVRAAAGTKVIGGFRPEAVTLDATFPIRVRVKVTEPTGAETHVFGHLGATEVVLVVRERVAFAPESDLGISITPSHLHVFDAASGARMVEQTEAH